MSSLFTIPSSVSASVATKSYILVVEDDQLPGMISAELAKNGYGVLRAAGEQDLRSHLNNPKFELVMFDLASHSGAHKVLDFVREIRNACNVPIILVSGHAQPTIRLRALEIGIDAYVTKPFLFREVLIRLERLLGSYKAEGSGAAGHNSVLQFSRFQLDPVRRSVQTTEGVVLDLTETEFNILGILVYAAGRIVTRDELCRRLRGRAWSPMDRALDVHVARLRAKLEPGVESPQIIKTARGIGYALADRVSSATSEGAFNPPLTSLHTLDGRG